MTISYDDPAAARQPWADVIADQAAEIEHLQAEMMRMRGEMIAQRTALALADEAHAALEASVPGLPRRARLARRVESLMSRVQELMREKRQPQRAAGLPAMLPGLHGKSVLCLGSSAPEVEAARELVERSGGAFTLRLPPADERDCGTVEACLAAADLVICHIGQIGHEVFRRVQDYCLRSRKHCLMVGA
ncbi:MAG: DUF2325 domain-containing protein [Pseudazoarcus pumilus]|nr:DUF2325 domain-containing protein [Pseudazoarcus pumilus]